MKDIEKKIIWSLVFGIVIFVAMSSFSNFSSIKQDISRFNYFMLIPVLSLSLGNFIIRYFRWETLLKVLGMRVKKIDSILIFLAGFVMSVTPGKFGEVFKSYLLKRNNNIEISRSGPIILAERIADLISLLVIISFGFFFFHYGIYFIIIAWLIMILGILFITNEFIAAAIFKILKKTKISLTKVEFLEKIFNSTKLVLKPKIIIISTLYGVVAWSLECIGLYLVISAFDVSISVEATLFIYAFSTLAGAIAMLPGGLGATEGSMASLLVIISNVPKNIAIISTMIIRMATLWFAVIIGVIAFKLFSRISNINLSEIKGANRV